MTFRAVLVRHLCVTLLFIAAPLGHVRAQQGDPVDDLIRAVLNDVSDLNYNQAIRGGNRILSASGALRPQQEVRLRLALAAAFYPESEGVQRPDSALRQFTRVIQLAPDAELPVVLAWPGLEALFERARSRTLAVALRPAADTLVVVGTSASATLPVVASRPVRFRLSTRRLGGAEVTHIATSTPSRTAELTLLAANSERVILERGEYELIVTASDVNSRDSTQTVRRIQVVGTAPTFLPLPVLDSARFRPEQLTPRPWRVAALGGLAAIATFVIADGMRATGDIAAETSPDSRAGIIGLSILGATGWAIWTDRTGTDPDAVEANAAVRALHERSVAAAISENARRLSTHRVTVRFVEMVR